MIRINRSVAVAGYLQWCNARDEALLERRMYATWHPYYNSVFGVPLH